MADLSFPLDKPLSSLGIKSRLLHLNGMLHAVRKWKDPQADKAIHLLVKDNIGVAGFPTSAGSYVLKDLELSASKDCVGIPISISSAKPI